MLAAILRRELFDHLQSLRFGVGFLLIVCLFIVSAVSWNVRHARATEDYQRAVQEAEKHLIPSARGGGWNLLAGGAGLWRPTSVTGFLAGGGDRGLPNHVHASSQGLRPSQEGNRNPLLFRRDVDWAFIVGFVGTLLALLLTHDGVAGEKETGTLRQALANPVPRDLLLLGKYLAALIATTVPVLTGAVLALLIMILAGQTPLTAEVCGAVVGVLGVGVLCLSVAVWLGLLLSARTASPALALMVALVVWSGLAVFLPGSGGLIGNRLEPVPRRSDLQRDIRAVWRERLPDSDPVVARLMEDYWRRLLGQLDTARMVTGVSPLAANRNVAEVLSSTGVTQYRAFLVQAQAYRQELTVFAEELDAAADVRAHAESVPVFHWRETPLRERMTHASGSVVLLLLYNGVCLLGAILSFRRYDVR